MISSVNSVSVNKSASTNQENGTEDKIKQKKKQMISQVEGEFYCTYLIDGDGNKILINRIPVSQTEKQGIGLNDSTFEKIKKEVFSKIKGSGANFESKQQAKVEAACKINTQEMMGILKACVGIPNKIE